MANVESPAIPCNVHFIRSGAGRFTRAAPSQEESRRALLMPVIRYGTQYAQWYYTGTTENFNLCN